MYFKSIITFVLKPTILYWDAPQGSVGGGGRNGLVFHWTPDLATAL